MKLRDLVRELGLSVQVNAGNLDEEPVGCYVSDLLSNVMGQAKVGALWVTMQGHQNVAAVASLLSLSAVIVAGGAAIETDTLKRAQENAVTILSTTFTTYEIVGELYAKGLKSGAR